MSLDDDALAHGAGFEPCPGLRVVVDPAPCPVDGELRRRGAAHLAAVRARAPRMHDGTVLALRSLRDGVLRVGPAGYFDRVATGDALRAEPGMRALAAALAGGDPLHCGAGRAAGVGVTTVATVRRGRGRALLLGRRAPGLPMDAGAWHVVPAGMLEPGGADPPVDTARREIAEELGLPAPPASAFAVLGVGWDLARLLPEICLRVDLDADGDAVAAGAPREEHSELALWPLDDLPALWAAHPPGTLVAAAAAAIALLAHDRGD